MNPVHYKNMTNLNQHKDIAMITDEAGEIEVYANLFNQ